jgi:DNA topoisomerase-2
MAEISKQYQKKTDREHILDNPDTYIGSVENVEQKVYVYENESSFSEINMEQYNPGLFKLFDEGIVNCRDHYIRMKTKEDSPENEKVTQINISINNGEITMYNNGNGIDVEIHPEYKLWIPEMIFGHLRTSTNYDKNKKKITGGKNGFGFKLVLIWSTRGSIETVDHIRGLKYIQNFNDNLNIIEKPKITKCKSKPYTKVTFCPDYQRLGLPNLSDSMVKLFQRRVYDIAGITPKDVKVKFNNELLKVNDFQSYIKMYLDEDSKKKFVFEKCNERWSYGVCLNNEYKHISFVNGIFTSKGGKHVEYILNQITKKMVQYIKQKKKVEVKASIIKEQLFVFVNCVIENPSFDSQTKDYLNTSVSKFGSTCEVGNAIIDKLAKMGVMNASCALSDIKDKQNAKKSDGSKNKNIRGIPKLVDANYAGTVKSKDTMLILCEGDSAKAGIISGLSNNDRNYIGVYPMKGKIFNVRGETQKRINDCKEIGEIKKILGLETGKSYSDTSKLRYSKLIFMTDQDLDGSHIKGLCVNFMSYLWPSLLEIPDFIGFMNTPILKATKMNKSINFYNNGEYEKWKEENENGKGYKIKYYKGLGTSTSKEFKEYFKEKRLVHFQLQENDKQLIDKIFNKGKADERKEWLGNYDRDSHLNIESTQISYNDFIDKELIHFSKYDCDRSIPNLMDGLKISQRKILFSAFKKKLYSEIKVAQFSGYISEQSGYHHGEASLNGAIVNMAQDFVGSNNINLFVPNGQFGTRLQGGKDHASERYIFTKLDNISRNIFRADDDPILTYLDDDGLSVEPIFYVPIIPMVLVNGSVGIGTGFSTSIPCFNPIELIQYIENMLTGVGENNITLSPYYRHFKGTIEHVDDMKYATNGNIVVKNDTLTITELPIGTWNEPYIVFLEKCLEEKKYGLKDYKDLSTDKDIQITLKFNNDVDLDNKQSLHNICQKFKLSSNISLTNMYLFDENEKLKHYVSVYEIIEDFVETRLKYYNIRKEYQIKKMEEELKICSNKYKFICEILEDTIDLRKKKSSEITQLLTDKGYDKQENSYNYLTKMPMDSLNEENVQKLKNEHERINEKLKELLEKTITQMYLEELSELKEVV